MSQQSKATDDETLSPPSSTAHFLGTTTGNANYETSVSEAVDVVLRTVVDGDGPYSGRDHERLRDRLADHDTLPLAGDDLTAVVEDLAESILSDVVRVHDEACIAHLQCPPAVPALVAEQLLAATNQSMDSFDQAPAPSVLEERLIADVADLFDYPETADGVFTSGGTQSNLMGLLLARDWYCDRRFDQSVQESGLPAGADDLRILCSDAVHFTAKQASHHLGLGEDAVVTVPTDDRHRIDLERFDETVAALERRGLEPFAIVGTAGTTDFGSVDPLGALATRAADHDCWYHVDAAYGGACAISDRLAPILDGIESADSIAIDFHKLLYQPISCGAFLLRDGSRYRYLDRNAAYLNPVADDDAGVPNLVGKSLQTSRRFDALKPYVTFRTLGRDGVADCVEYVFDLADAAAAAIRERGSLELLCDPELSTVVFRYCPENGAETEPEPEPEIDAVNRAIRDELLADGEAVVARTTVDGSAALKFTLLNPCTTMDTIRTVLTAVERHGQQLETEVMA